MELLLFRFASFISSSNESLKRYLMLLSNEFDYSCRPQLLCGQTQAACKLDEVHHVIIIVPASDHLRALLHFDNYITQNKSFGTQPPPNQLAGAVVQGNGPISSLSWYEP
jgi:hypothetical protein